MHGSVIQETETRSLSGLHSEETLGAGDSKMVQEIKVLAAKPEDQSLILAQTWWRETTDS